MQPPVGAEAPRKRSETRKYAGILRPNFQIALSKRQKIPQSATFVKKNLAERLKSVNFAANCQAEYPF